MNSTTANSAGAETKKQAEKVHVATAQIHLTNVKLRDDVILDEVHLEGENILAEAPQNKGDNGRITATDTKVRAMMTEANVNLLLAGNVPADAPVRNLSIAILSGKVRITGHVVKSVMSLPFTIEAIPRIDNGVRVWLDFQSSKMVFNMPASVTEMIEQQINKQLAIDLSKLPFAVRIDEIRCEPARLTVLAKANIVLPPAPAAALLSAPFRAVTD